MWDIKTFKDLVTIKAFQPESVPVFSGTESEFDFVVWNLYDRITRGLKSFALLCDNRQFYDAFLVAGNLLEACAVFSYIKDNKTEEKCLKHLNTYLAQSTAGQMIKTLSWYDDLQDNFAWRTYIANLTLFAPIGANIIKPLKNNKTKAENHQIFLNELKCRTGSNANKKKIISENYKILNSEGYVRAFSKTLEKLDNGNFKRMYDKYCDFKHINIMSSGITTKSMEGYLIGWAIEIMAIIALYLQRYGLNPKDNLLA